MLIVRWQHDTLVVVKGMVFLAKKSMSYNPYYTGKFDIKISMHLIFWASTVEVTICHLKFMAKNDISKATSIITKLTNKVI